MDSEFCTIRNLISQDSIDDKYKSQSKSGGLLTKGLYKKKNKPVISVITISYNCKLDLVKTVNSVISQKYENIEYIIIDGNSKDGSVEYLEKNSDVISFWLSEPDDGIYDAMNKGLSFINGDYHLFLNAGDIFVGDVISEEILNNCPAYISCYYHNLFHRIKQIKPVYFKFRIPYNHQGIIFESKGITYSKVNKIADDYQYYIDHGYKTLKLLNSDGFVYFDNSGLSSKEYKSRDTEISVIIRKNFGIVFFIIFKAQVALKNLIRLLVKKS